MQAGRPAALLAHVLVIAPAAAQVGADTAPVEIAGLVETELAGNSLSAYPFFEYVRAFNAGATVEVAVDTALFPRLIGKTVDCYVVAAKTKEEWLGAGPLSDATAAVEAFTFGAGPVQTNTVLVDAGALSGPGTVLDIALGYDAVLDVDRDGRLSPGDFIDGFGNEPGLHVVRDLAAPGPLAVTEALYTGGPFKTHDAYYPTDIAALDELPLILLGHGNGQSYQWYDHLGTHMASHGYVFVSYQNNTGPGPDSAASTTLTNTDWFLGNLNTILNGALEGHVDPHRIAWIGHGRGGEGVVRAYDMLFDGTFTPVEYGMEDIRLVSAIAPSDFLGFAGANPHDANTHLWVGGADGSISGCADCDLCQPFQVQQRATHLRQSISLHGVGHTDFHDGPGPGGGVGPCLVGKPDTHAIMRGHLLPLAAHHLRGSLPAKDYLWRQWEGFRPIGAPAANPCVVVDLTFREADSGAFVVDDFQSEPAPTVSSSGGAVAFDVPALAEGPLDDANQDFTHDPADLMNGMTQAGLGDEEQGLVLTFDGAQDYSLAFDLVPAAQDVSGFAYLSFRACQATRHPLTTADVGDTTFTVSLVDGSGAASAIGVGVFGGGVEEPYQRTGCGVGAGWNNEFETIRVRVSDFLRDGSGLDPTDVRRIVFGFGPSHGTSAGRLGLDELLFAAD